MGRFSSKVFSRRCLGAHTRVYFGLEMFFPVFVTDLKIVLSGQFRAGATPQPISQSSRTLKG